MTGLLTVLWVLMVIAGALLGLAFYLIPTIIALVRRAPNTASIAAINVLLGWSLIGWAVALAMALRDPARNPSNGPVTVVQNAAPPVLPPGPYPSWDAPPLPPGGPYGGGPSESGGPTTQPSRPPDDQL